MLKYASSTPWLFSPSKEWFKFYAAEGLFIIDEGKTKCHVVPISLRTTVLFFRDSFCRAVVLAFSRVKVGFAFWGFNHTIDISFQ